MSSDTVKQEKQNPMRVWLERNLGKVILAAIPVVVTMLAGWVYNMGSEIAVIKEKMKEDEAQWNALLSTNDKIRNLEIEGKVNQKLLYLISEKDIDPELLHLERLLKTENPELKGTGVGEEGKAENKGLENSGDRPEIEVVRPKFLLPTLKPRQERVDEFRKEQMEQIQQSIPKR
jgi:hypothetical protein